MLLVWSLVSWYTQSREWRRSIMVEKGEMETKKKVFEFAFFGTLDVGEAEVRLRWRKYYFFVLWLLWRWWWRRWWNVLCCLGLWCHAIFVYIPSLLSFLLCFLIEIEVDEREEEVVFILDSIEHGCGCALLKKYKKLFWWWRWNCYCYFMSDYISFKLSLFSFSLKIRETGKSNLCVLTTNHGNGRKDVIWCCFFLK